MFKSRFYNKIEDYGHYIKKSSLNSKKLSEEINFYLKMPSELKKYFPKLGSYDVDNQTFYFLKKINGKTASEEYLLDYDSVYINCKNLLDAAFLFLKERPFIKESSKNSCKYLYSDKVYSRFHLFKQTGLYDKMNNDSIYKPFIQKYEDILCRYLLLASKMLTPCDYVVYHHGDFCLTNMFMQNKQLKLIDPMGYEDVFKIMHDPFYDLAKLSHSILGNYDRILNDDYTISLEEKDFPFTLNVDKKSVFAKILFFNKLKANGYDYDQVRIREASLFLSMLPLHPESLRRIGAFILQAEQIITELEQQNGNV